MWCWMMGAKQKLVMTAKALCSFLFICFISLYLEDPQSFNLALHNDIEQIGKFTLELYNCRELLINTAKFVAMRG